jgi:CRP-like cAMP-binding protein
MLEANKMVLKESPIFYYNFSDAIIQKTVSLIHENNFSPNSEIFTQNELTDSSIFFIEKGSVEIFYYQHSPYTQSQQIKSIRVLERGEVFG